MIRKEEKIQSKLIDNVVLDAIPAEKKDISLASADLVVMADVRALEDIVIVPEKVPGPVIVTESASTEEEVLIAASAVEAGPNIKKTKAKSAKSINPTGKKKRVRRAVADLHRCLSHDMHDVQIKVYQRIHIVALLNIHENLCISCFYSFIFYRSIAGIDKWRADIRR